MFVNMGVQLFSIWSQELRAHTLLAQAEEHADPTILVPSKSESVKGLGLGIFELNFLLVVSSEGEIFPT